MKKYAGKLLCLLCAAAMCTGCGKQKTNIENDFVTVEADAVEEKYQQAMDDAKQLLTDYYLGLHAGSFSQCMGGYPEFYQDAERKWMEESTMTMDRVVNPDGGSLYDAFTKENDDFFRYEFGDDYKVTLKISQLYDLTEDSCKEMESILKNNFQQEIDLSACYSISVTETMHGSKKSEDTSINWYLLSYDGKTYLYDNAHETI